MASSPAPDPRILILGLRDPSFPDGGAGAYMARSMRVSFPDIEVRESPEGGPDFASILRDYDLVIVLDCIAMCSGTGRVLVVSPYAFPSLKGEWDEQARALDAAIHEARLFGHRVPAIHVVAVCMPDRDTSPDTAAPVLAAFYKAVVPKAKQIVRDIVREARTPVEPPAPTG